MGRAGRRKQKSSEFLKKIYAVGYLTSSAKQMLFQPPVCHQIKVKELVFIVLFLCVFICIICTYYVCLYFIYLYLFTNTWPIHIFWKKGYFACSHS